MTRNPHNPSAQETVAGRIRTIREVIAAEAAAAGRDPGEVKLMAVTKTVDPGRVNQALEAGVPLLGENRAQELREKFQFYACDSAKIHFIGHLQTNKIRDIINRVACVESVDSLRLAEELNNACRKAEKTLDIFLQVNIGSEPQKSGFLPEEVPDAARAIAALDRLHIRGLMAVPPHLPGDRYLAAMAELREELRAMDIPGASFDELSMGMSEDYAAAVRHGATILRIGRGIFGDRT